MKLARAAGMPDGQGGGLRGVGQRRVFIDEARQQYVHGNALPPRLGGKACFGFP